MADSSRSGLKYGGLSIYEACGTLSGYTYHKQRNTPVCQPCKAARKAYAYEYYLRTKGKNRKRTARNHEPAECGTMRAYYYHRKHKQPIDIACYNAFNENRALRKAEKLGLLCGTLKSYFKHVARKETPCRACKDAYNEHRRKRHKESQVLNKRQKEVLDSIYN